MKIFIKVILAIVVLVLLAGISAFTYAYLYGAELDSSSRQFVEDGLPKLLNENLSIPNSTSKGDICNGKEITKQEMVSKLGKFEKISSINGQARITITYQINDIISANYISEAIYEHGSAQIHVVLGRKKGQWWFSNIQINSKVVACE